MRSHVGDLSFELGHWRVAGFGGGGGEFHLQAEIADIGLGVVDYGEGELQFAGAGLGHGEPDHLDVLGKGVLLGGDRGAGRLGRAGLGLFCIRRGRRTSSQREQERDYRKSHLLSITRTPFHAIMAPRKIECSGRSGSRSTPCSAAIPRRAACWRSFCATRAFTRLFFTGWRMAFTSAAGSPWRAGSANPPV